MNLRFIDPAKDLERARLRLLAISTELNVAKRLAHSRGKKLRAAKATIAELRRQLTIAGFPGEPR